MKKTKSSELFSVGSVHPSNNHGSFKVIDYINPKNIEVQFLETNSITSAPATALKMGVVKDKNKPTLYGVGKLGYGDHAASKNGKELEVYLLWKNMISLCYGKPDIYNKNFRESTVHQEWLTFQVFADWYAKNKSSPEKMKVKLHEGKKIFSKYNCDLVPAKKSLLS